MAVGLVFLAIAIFAVARLDHAATQAQVHALEVQPVVHLSGDGDSWESCLAEGLTRDLVRSLGEDSRLQVVTSGSPQTSSQATHGRRVEAVVEGSVERRGDRVWVTARLVETGTRRALWKGRFDASTCDLDSLRKRLAAAIGGQVRQAMGTTPPAPPPSAVS